MPKATGRFHLTQLVRILLKGIKNLCQVPRAGKISCALARYPSIEAVVMGDDWVARSEGFHQRRVSSTDPVTVDVGLGVKAERSYNLSIIDGTREFNIGARGSFNRSLELVAEVRIVTNDKQWGLHVW